MITKIFSEMPWLLPVMIIAIIWDLTWTLIGLWRSARAGQTVWFICIGILNTMGILPIIYLLLEKRKPVKQQ